MQQIYRRAPMAKCRHGYSSVNLLHIIKTPFSKNTSGRLLLKIAKFQWIKKQTEGYVNQLKATLLKRDLNAGVFLWILRKVEEQLFYRIPSMAAFTTGSPELLCKKPVLKNFVIFTGKDLWRNLFLRDSNIGVFLSILQNFLKFLYRKASANYCFRSLYRENSLLTVFTLSYELNR